MNISDLSLFIRTADMGSITAAADQLGLSPATASAALRRLEKQLGAALFIRSTRQLRLTSEGERFLVYCRQALAILDEGLDSLSAMHGKVAGEIRLSVSSDLGRNIVLPWLDEAMDTHPELSLHLSVGDTLSDFYLDRIDVALRYGQPEDSGMVAFHIAQVDRIAFASPDYLRRFGEPLHPEELSGHNCLLYMLGHRAYDIWEFSRGDDQFRVKVRGNRESNDADIVRRWAVAGHGIAYKSSLDVSTDLRAGNVVRLLPDYQSKSLDVWLICPSRKQVSPAILMLRDLLREKCAATLSTL